MKKAKQNFFLPLSLKIFMITLLMTMIAMVSLYQLLGKILGDRLVQELKSDQLQQSYQLVASIEKDSFHYITLAKIFIESSSSIDQKNIQRFFSAHPEILYIAEGNKAHLANPAIGIDRQAIIRQLALDLLKQPPLSLAIINITNFSSALASLSIGLSYQHDLDDQHIFILVRPPSLTALLEGLAISSRQSSLFILDREGDIILHPSEEISGSRANYAHLPIVKALLQNSNQSSSMQRSYREAKRDYLTSAVIASRSNLVAVTTTPQPPLLEAMMYSIAAPLLLLSCTLMAMVIYLFMRPLTCRLALLSKALLAVTNENYSPLLVAPSNDEVGHAIEMFNTMSLSLAQRYQQDSSNIAFSKKNFTKKAPILSVMAHESKNVAILCTNIHSFSSFSKALTPSELIDFFNDYSKRMITCIAATNGYLHTMMGDKIIAIWGMHSSMGNPSKGAIDGALLMREALISFNLKRASNRLPAIKLGFGVSVGALVLCELEANNMPYQHLIGSVIGLAARLEALTKSFAADIIVSEPAFIQAGYYYHSQALEKIIQKGEPLPQKIYSIEGKKSDGSSLFNIKERLNSASKVEKLLLPPKKQEGHHQ